MSLLEFTTTMDSSNSEEPPAKKYRYSSERHPLRIFEDFIFDGLDDDNTDDDDSLPVGHHFAEVSRISTFTATASAERRHPALQVTAPRRVSVASMDDEDDIADVDIQQHNGVTTFSKTTSNTKNTSNNTTTSTAIPRNVSLQLFELTKSDADAATATTTTNGTARNDASLPSLAHSSASSATHPYEMAKDMMILEE